MSSLCCEELRRLFGLLESIDARLARLERADDDLPDSIASNPRLQQFARLRRLLGGRDPGEQAAIIQQRMGLSRATYYRLRIKFEEASLTSETPRETRARQTRTP